MTSHPATLGFALVAAFAMTSPAHAQLPCKTDLAQLGDSKASVLQKCGEPVLKDSFCKPFDRSAGAASTPLVVPCERIDEWTYYPGYGQFLTTLRFEAGALRAISYGDRVK